MSALVDEFGGKLVKQVRDSTITSCGVLRNPHARSPMRLKLNELDRNVVDRVLDLVIPDIVDDTLFHLLRAIDGGDIRLVYIADDGRECDLTTEGGQELAGWYRGEDGWVSRHSKADPAG